MRHGIMEIEPFPTTHICNMQLSLLFRHEMVEDPAGDKNVKFVCMPTCRSPFFFTSRAIRITKYCTLVSPIVKIVKMQRVLLSFHDRKCRLVESSWRICQVVEIFLDQIFGQNAPKRS